MAQATTTSKGQITVPKDIRDELHAMRDLSPESP